MRAGKAVGCEWGWMLGARGKGCAGDQECKDGSKERLVPEKGSETGRKRRSALNSG